MLHVFYTHACIQHHSCVFFLFLLNERKKAHFRPILFCTQTKIMNILQMKTRETTERGSDLLSTHFWIQMSTPLRNPLHVNIVSSGHDPLPAGETVCLGTRLLRSPEPFTVSKNLVRLPSTPLQNNESQIGQKWPFCPDCVRTFCASGKVEHHLPCIMFLYALSAME